MQVAVVDFTDLQGGARQLGRFVAEEISTNLVLAAKGFSVIDRNHLRTILKEQKLSMSGLMDPENQKKVGKILGVDALVLGNITPFGESYRVTFKVVATDTAAVLVADRGMVPKTPATEELWGAVIEEQGAGGAASDGSAVRSPVAAPASKKGEFRNQYLSLVIESISLSADKMHINVVVRLTNVTKHDISVGLQGGDDGVGLADDAGVRWVLADAVVGLRSFPWNYRTCRDPKQCDDWVSLLTPGQSQPLNFAFRPKANSKVGDPKVFSFDAGLHLKVPEAGKSAPEGAWRYVHVGAGISGIKLN
jgi:TolB-like protein